MKIEKLDIPIRDVINGYVDSEENGVFGYDGKLNIRPAFQREFVYKPKQRDEVINTVRKGFPLNVMYWVVADDGHYEILDGQQRTVSICQYVQGDYSINFKYFHTLTKEEQDEILDYPLTVYICTGTDREKLDWFKVINTVGEQLTTQELRNAIYTGPWLTDAKKYFSKSQCPAYQIGADYLSGSTIRQEFLETALKWLSVQQKIEIEEYMAAHQFDESAIELWLYFQNVINWVKSIFPNYRNLMKGLDWGPIYDKYHSGNYNPKELEDRIVGLLEDEDVSKPKGIFEYVLGGPERLLSIRGFKDKDKRLVYEKQRGVCPVCGKHFEFDEMEGDHITPWSQGGHTVISNLQMLCKDDNRKKSGI
ncbi:MAG: DUF262 domain-containing protein [Oenococcus sp.]|uniref:HNH endonuclease family protein n=1 Tax=Oenococcus sp. TaxID=1979414 RepID=UPI0039E8A3AD